MKNRHTIFITMLLAFCCLALLPRLHAVTPAPDGGYPGANTAEGYTALFSLTNGTYNTAIGSRALHDNTTGSSNTATGNDALYVNTTGGYNTATGFGTLTNNTTGSYNTASGSGALGFNFTGHNNTATGVDALADNNGSYNTASGGDALVHNAADNNTATGYQALYTNTFGTQNTADGFGALFSNIDGSYNTATGLSALLNNTRGNSNTADGINALLSNTTGSLNVALGDRAGANLTTGSNNIVIGAGVLGVAGESNKIRIGKQGTQNGTFIAGIYNVAVTGSSVVVNSSGKLGVAVSSARFKDEVKPMDGASEAILALKPVMFRYKKELDPERRPQFGLLAEDVEKLNRDLVVRDSDGKLYTVRYDAINVMLLNEFLKEHKAFLKEQCKVQEQSRKIQVQEATITQLKEDFRATVAQLTTRFDEQASQIQKVSAQLEANKPAPQVVNNP